MADDPWSDLAEWMTWCRRCGGSGRRWRHLPRPACPSCAGGIVLLTPKGNP